MNTNPYSLIGTEGSGWVFEILEEWIYCGWRAIGEVLIEVGRFRGEWYLSPLGNR